MSKDLNLTELIEAYNKGEIIAQISPNHFKKLYKELCKKYSIGDVICLKAEGHKEFDMLMKITLISNGYDVRSSEHFLDVWYA